MENSIEKDLEIIENKLLLGSVKSSWVKKNYPLLYEYLEKVEGDTLSEKIYLLKRPRGLCKTCDSRTEFLSLKRGYRDFCSKLCSNGNKDLIDQKLEIFRRNSLEKWGYKNPSLHPDVRLKLKDSLNSLDKDQISKKIRETLLDKYGVENVSQIDEVKKKKVETLQKNLGVDNPFKSEKIKQKIKETLIQKFGVDSPRKSEVLNRKAIETTKRNWGVENYTQSQKYKDSILEKWRKEEINSTIGQDPNFIEYLGNRTYFLKCDLGKDHNYQIHTHLYGARTRINSPKCLICNPLNNISSTSQIEIFNYIKSIYSGEVILNYRDGLEIDMYLPSLSIGFEYNGLYWHSEIYKNKSYHLDKLEFFSKKGIRIIQIWEDDWSLKKDIIKSQIKNWIRVSTTRISARKCRVKKVDSVSEYRDFLDKNHIQGYTSSSLRLGLYYGDQLVSLMTFDHFSGRKRMKDDEWNLSRFCNILDTTIPGAASKLLTHFEREYSPKLLVSFSDRSWSLGTLYYRLGFNLDSITGPNFSYLLDGRRQNKQKFTKQKLVKMGYNRDLSEHQIVFGEFGALRIWDLGQMKFVKTYFKKKHKIIL